MTLAAIAKELEYRNAGTMADVHLATGLPLTSFGRDKKAFRDYLCRDGKPVSFRFECLDYTITISKVSLYPQGYAAVLTQSGLLNEPSEQIRRSLGLSMTAAQIESVLRSDTSHVNEDSKKIIHLEAERYTKRLLSAIAESGLDVRAMPAVFLGGGAALLKRHVSAADGLCRPVILDDVSLNAKGYEWLTERLEQKHEQ